MGEDVYEVEGDAYPDMEEDLDQDAHEDIDKTIEEKIDETVKDDFQAEENEEKMQSNKTKLVRVGNYFRREFRLGNRKLPQSQSFRNVFKKSGTLYIDHQLFTKSSINYVYDMWFYAQDFYCFSIHVLISMADILCRFRLIQIVLSCITNIEMALSCNFFPPGCGLSRNALGLLGYNR